MMPKILRQVFKSLFFTPALLLASVFYLGLILFPFQVNADYQADFVDMLNMGIPGDVAQALLDCDCGAVVMNPDGTVTVVAQGDPSIVQGIADALSDYAAATQTVDITIGGQAVMNWSIDPGSNTSYSVDFAIDPGIYDPPGGGGIADNSFGGGRIDGRAWVDRNGNGVFEAEGPYKVCEDGEYATCETLTRPASEADYYLNGVGITLKGYSGPVWQNQVFLTATATTSAIPQPSPRPTPTPTPCPDGLPPVRGRGESGTIIGGSISTNSCAPNRFVTPTPTPEVDVIIDYGVFDHKARLPLFGFLNKLFNPGKAYAQFSIGGDRGTAGWRWTGDGWYLFPGLPVDLINPIPYTVEAKTPRGYKVSTARLKTVMLGSCIVPGGCPLVVRNTVNGRVSYTLVGGGSINFRDYLITSQIDFGLRPITPVTVQGHAFVDRNGNKIKEASEPGVGNVRIAVGKMPSSGQGFPTFTELEYANTDSSGHYIFDNVEAGGNYKFSVNPPSGGPYTSIPTSWAVGQQPFLGGDLNSDTTLDFPLAGPLPTPTPTGVSGCGVSGGSVYIDSVRSNCGAGRTAYTGASTFTLNSSSSQTGQRAYPSTPPTYEVADNSCTGQRFLTISSIPGNYRVSSASIDGGAFLSSNLSSAYTTTGFSYSNPTDQRNISWCLVQGGSWFQTDTGDVRMPNLVNQIFKDGEASTDPNFPGIFISSQGDPNFGGFTPSVKNWKVGREYSYNDDFKKGLGGVSYSFYASQAKTRGIPITNVTSATFDPSSRTSGVYQTTGNITLTGGTVPANAHIILLVNGGVTISGNVSSPAGSGRLFIVAAKGDINIPDTVTSLAGIYTSEKSINILSRANCASGVADSQINIQGALISNALYPFETGQGGQVKNNRDLCGANTTTPSLVVTSRPDFLTQMTDFYKTTYKTFREVEP